MKILEIDGRYIGNITNWEIHLKYQKLEEVLKLLTIGNPKKE